MSEAAKNNNAQVKDNPKTTNIANSNTIIERNSVASPMQAKDGAKAVVISAKEQQEPVKEVKVVSQKTEVKPTESSAFAKEDASSVKAQKAKSVGTEPSKGSPVPNKVEQKSIQNGAISVSPKTISAPQAEHTNQASVKPVPNNSQQGSKTVVMNNQPTTTNTSNNANQANKEQPIQGKPLATPVQAASPAVVKTVEEEQKQTQSKEDHKDIFKDLFVKLKSVWQNLNVGVKRYLALVLIPSLICLGYFGLWASPMYISEVKFAVKSAEGGTSGFNLMTTLFRVPTASLQDAMVVEEFLKSNDAFYAADRELDLIKHYTDQKYDLISRLSFAPTIDDIASFWNNVTKINVNQDSNVITFEVRAYTPEMAQNINEEVLHISEDLVNSMNERAKEDMLQLADLEVAEARDRLTVAQDALRDFRNKNITNFTLELDVYMDKKQYQFYATRYLPKELKFFFEAVVMLFEHAPNIMSELATEILSVIMNTNENIEYQRSLNCDLETSDLKIYFPSLQNEKELKEGKIDFLENVNGKYYGIIEKHLVIIEYNNNRKILNIYCDKKELVYSIYTYQILQKIKKKKERKFFKINITDKKENIRYNFLCLGVTKTGMRVIKQNKIATIPWKTIKKDSIKILEDKDNQLKEELEKIMKS